MGDLVIKRLKSVNCQIKSMLNKILKFFGINKGDSSRQFTFLDNEEDCDEEDISANEDLEPRELRENESYCKEDIPEIEVGKTMWVNGMERNYVYTRIRDGRIRVTKFPLKI